MAELSEATWAVITAYDEAPFSGRPAMAAVLRAAADQVVPLTPKPDDTFCCPPVETIGWRRQAEIRRQFLAIAAELEALDD